MDSTLITLIIKLVFAGALAFFLYKDAKARDYNWLMWTLLPAIVLFGSTLTTSIFFLSVLLLIYLNARPKGDLNPCPHCKKKIHYILAFCPFCHNSVKRECLRCHETVDWEATRCPHCHSPNLTDS